MSYSETTPGTSSRSWDTPNGCECGCTANPSIECTVKSCAFHCKSEDYCSLDRIKVVTHEKTPKTTECVDCQSFRPETTTPSSCSTGSCTGCDCD